MDKTLNRVLGKIVVSAEADHSESSEYHLSLEFYVFQENGDYIAYCPSLDLSTSGSDFVVLAGELSTMIW